MKELADLLGIYPLLVFMGAGVFHIVLWIGLSMNIPKSIKSRYLVTPYFSEGELFAYGFYPGKLVLTVSLATAVCFPSQLDNSQFTSSTHIISAEPTNRGTLDSLL